MKKPAKTSKTINLAYIFHRNKRDFSAKSLSLLLLALRPRLFRLKLVKLAILPIITIFTLLYIVNISANKVSATSITLTIPSQLSLNITPSINGTFSKSTPGSIGVTTDGKAGYTLSIKSSNGSNDLKHSNGNDKLSSVTTNLTEDNYKSSGNLNTWGWLPSKLYDTQNNTSKDNTNFLPGPTGEDTIIDKTEVANSDKANNYTITLGSKVDNNIPAGNYSNTFIISASANTLPYDAIMQDWDGCEALGEEQTLRLLDNRDDNIYTVSKLKDGKCWMVENLRLGKTSTINLSSSDTDISSSYTLPASSTNGFRDNIAANVYVDPTHGGYYTWIAATAGTGSSINNYTDAPGSICPKGWRLPTGSSGGEFETMAKQYGDGHDATTATNLQKTPIPGFVLSGLFRNSSASDQGSYGRYWSSTVNNSTLAYGLRLNSSSVEPTYLDYRYDGDSIRCISRSTDPTMQNVETWADSVQKGQSLEGVVDTRDGNTYTVARLEDGKLWMTQNLRLGKSTTMTLTPDDSDVASNYTLPASSTSGFSSDTAQNIYVTPSPDNNKYGGHYTWAAATAGTNPSSGEASHSICPKGWRLPTKTEFDTLTNNYTYNTITQSPAYFVLAGLYNGSSLTNSGTDGYWWSSAAGSSANAYFLYLGPRSGNFYAGVNGRRYGYSIRCVSRQ